MLTEDQKTCIELRRLMIEDPIEFMTIALNFYKKRVIRKMDEFKIRIEAVRNQHIQNGKDRTKNIYTFTTRV